MGRNSHHTLAERPKGEAGQAEIHLPPRDADNGDVEQTPKEDMGEEDVKTTDEKPDDIHQGVETAATSGDFLHVRPERPESQHAQLEGLQPPRNADNGEAEHQSGCEILEGGGQSAKKKPKKVS